VNGQLPKYEGGSTMNNVLDKRRAGVLLHITSLPSSLGLGTLSRRAYWFIDFLKSSGLSVWQVLPIHPLHRVPIGTPHRDFLSPYQPMSVFAGDPMLINFHKLVDRGWLPRMTFSDYSSDQIEQAFEYRHQCLNDAYLYFAEHANLQDKKKFDDFVEQQNWWLEDYALFCALKDFYIGACWWDWADMGHRNHDPDALAQFRQRKEHYFKQYYFEQFAFFTQWQELKQYANDNGVYLFGDMPFFVAQDSVDVWAHREYFQLDQNSKPLFLSGSPPKNHRFHFDKGQCWGHPLYDWRVASEESFQWWLKRFNMANYLFDIVRLTYFQGFHDCWAIRNEQSIKPENGNWQRVPGSALFTELQKQNLPLPIVADVGVTDGVIQLRNKFKFLSIKLLQLAFDMKQEEQLGNYHLPHYHLPRDVVYTGTHDSDTTKNWFFKTGTLEEQENNEKKQKFICNYLGSKAEDMPLPLVRAAFQSPSKLAIVPMQDLLSLEGECRMNIPGTSVYSNWRWQLPWQELSNEIVQQVRELVEQYDRN
jgi:4-alpha-glucanotransferase